MTYQMWQQWDSNPQPLSSQTNTQLFSQMHLFKFKFTSYNKKVQMQNKLSLQ